MAIKTRPRGGRHRRGAPPRSQPSKNGSKRGFFRRFWWAFVAAPLVVLAAVIATLWFVYANLDVPQTPPGQQTTFVYDRDGKVITTLHAAVDRTEIPFSEMPQSLRDAVIAVEDKDYYRHGGISFFGIVRAAWANLTSGEIEQGGSTITQQYVKTVFTGSERTFTRKIKEAMLAVKVDHRYTKDEILARYLNAVYFGNGAYGAEAAARTYFDKPARKLSVLQSATMAGLIQRPEGYDPVDHPDAARDRRNVVLDLMADQGYLPRAEADGLKAEPVKVRKPRTQSSSRYAYFVDYVRRQLLDRFGPELTYGGGLRVRTTLDAGWQRAAEKAVADHLPDPKDPSAAVVAIDPRNGAIRALVGGKDFNKVQFNAAFQAHRSAGSAFKPFTLTAAFEQRISPKSIWHGPPSIVIPDRRCYTNGKPWEVHNYADEGQGTMTLLQATALSVNTIFAQLVVEVGPDQVVDVAQRMGIQSPLEPVCSITLGSQGVTPLEMADSYATLASRGVRHDPVAYSRITDTSGEALDRPGTKGERALEQNDADLVTYALQQVVQSGTGTAANIGRPVAGKTGTGQDYKNAWFCGYTPQLVACVWMGYEEKEAPMENVEGVAGVTGGSIPAQIWRDFMLVAMEGQDVMTFHTPSFAGYTGNPSGVSPPSSPQPSPSPSPSPSPTKSVLPLPTITLPPTPTFSSSPTPTPSATASPSPP